MIRSASFLCLMTRLALLAALLMAFAPSMSRVLAGTGSRVLAGWTELCTTDGIKWVDTRVGSPLGKAGAPSGMPMGGDCAYCALAAVLPLLLLCLGMVFPRVARGAIRFTQAPPRDEATRLRGLGGQGPPILL